MIDYTRALIHLKRQFSCGESYDSIIMYDNLPMPTEEEIAIAWEEVKLLSLKDSLRKSIGEESVKRLGDIESLQDQIILLSDMCRILIKENKSYNDIQDDVHNARRYIPSASEKDFMKSNGERADKYKQIEESKKKLLKSIDSMTKKELENLNPAEDIYWI